MKTVSDSVRNLLRPDGLQALEQRRNAAVAAGAVAGAGAVAHIAEDGRPVGGKGLDAREGMVVTRRRGDVGRFQSCK